VTSIEAPRTNLQAPRTNLQRNSKTTKLQFISAVYDRYSESAWELGPFDVSLELGCWNLVLQCYLVLGAF
jgi:hypothetical protein